MVAAILVRLLPYVHSLIPLISRVHTHEALPASTRTKLRALDLEDLLQTTATYVNEIKAAQLPESIVVALESVERQLMLVNTQLSTLHDELESQTRWSAWFWSFVVTPQDTTRLVTDLTMNSSILRHRLDLLFGIVRAAPNPTPAEMPKATML